MGLKLPHMIKHHMLRACLLTPIATKSRMRRPLRTFSWLQGISCRLPKGLFGGGGGRCSGAAAFTA